MLLSSSGSKSLVLCVSAGDEIGYFLYYSEYTVSDAMRSHIVGGMQTGNDFGIDADGTGMVGASLAIAIGMISIKG